MDDGEMDANEMTLRDHLLAASRQQQEQQQQQDHDQHKYTHARSPRHSGNSPNSPEPEPHNSGSPHVDYAPPQQSAHDHHHHHRAGDSADHIDPAIAHSHYAAMQQVAESAQAHANHAPQALMPGLAPMPPQAWDEEQQQQQQPATSGRGQQSPNYKRRELNSTKRAAQNRAAQRAFRARKEEYIKKLEEDMRAGEAMQDEFQRQQTENYHLRDYIVVLQSRLLDLAGEYPPPPSTVELRDPRRYAPGTVVHEGPGDADMTSASAVEQQLRAAAAQAAGLGAEEAVGRAEA